MEFIVLILLGAILITYGWYWGGVTESRSTAVAVGGLSLVLGGIAIFNPGEADVIVWAVAGLTAVFGLLAAASAYWEQSPDRTLGLYSLLLAVAALLSVGADVNATDNLNTLGIAGLILAGVFALVFVAGALVPGTRAFRSLIGWVMLVAGAVVAFLGYAEAIGISVGT
ncbi:MAG: hypothetical protein BMS9Abin07_1631 [Acidimicrobiia bacterium]|nr:MAG: hypothetical protein BMS9Abin07_1631 [Acidimicrobiia bacterium]